MHRQRDRAHREQQACAHRDVAAAASASRALRLRKASTSGSNQSFLLE